MTIFQTRNDRLRSGIVVTIFYFFAALSATAQQEHAMQHEHSMPERKPVVIWDAFFVIATNDFMKSAYELSAKGLPRRLPKGVKAIPPRVIPQGADSVSFCGGDYHLEFASKECPICLPEGVKRRYYETPEKFTYFGFHRGTDVEYFFPCYKTIVTEKMKDALNKTAFTGYDYLLVENMDDFALFPDPPRKPDEPLTEPKLFLLIYSGKGDDREFARWLNLEYGFICKACGWGPRICPICDGYVNECPKCGPQEYDGKGSSQDFFEFTRKKPLPDEIRFANCVDFPYYKKIDAFFSPKMPCLVGEMWDGSDFVKSEGNFTGFITGRVAQWIVENRYGPVLLVPYPVDISRCNKEQLETIEKIRYRTLK